MGRSISRSRTRIFSRQSSKMSYLDEIRERYVASQDQGREAFEELALYTSQLESEQIDKQELARSKIDALKSSNSHRREKLHRLREKYTALLDLYNDLAEEAHDRSDSSSSSSSSDDENCSIM